MCSIKTGVLKNFAKFTRKHLCQSFFLNKVAAQQLYLCEIFKNTIFTEHLWVTASVLTRAVINQTKTIL